MKDYILDRAKEASTWRGVCLFLTAIGIPIAPDYMEAIVSVGMSVAGLIGMITKD